jgi:hypothetical protein
MRFTSLIAFYLLLGTAQAWAAPAELYESLVSAAGRFVLGEIGLGEQMISRGREYYTSGRWHSEDPVETLMARVRARYLETHPEQAPIFWESAMDPLSLLPVQRQELRALVDEEFARIDFASMRKESLASLRESFVNAEGTATESARAAWIRRSRWKKGTTDQVLATVRDEAIQHAASGRKAAVVFDLDETGIENRSSAVSLLQGPEGWIRSAESAKYPRAREALSRLPLGRMKVSPEEIFIEAGIADEKEAMGSVDRFFHEQTHRGSHALKYGTALPGFARYVRALHDQGVHIVYLTGRTGSEQGVGTRAMLEFFGLPLDERATLLMKPPGTKTPEFKAWAMREQILGAGLEPVAMFDNEPENLMAVREASPGMKLVVMDTEFSHVPARPGTGMYRVRHW